MLQLIILFNITTAIQLRHLLLSIRVQQSLGKCDRNVECCLKRKQPHLVNPSQEVGIEEQKQDWISHELRNFKGTIEVLVAQCEACVGNVTVDFK